MEFLLISVILITAILLLLNDNLFRKLMLFLAILVEVGLIFLVYNNVFFFSAQIVIYIGSILTLLIILFVSYRNILIKNNIFSVAAYFIVLFVSLLLLTPVILQTFSKEIPEIFTYFSLTTLAENLFYENYLFFELISLLFFFVLIIGVYLLRKYQNE